VAGYFIITLLQIYSYCPKSTNERIIKKQSVAGKITDNNILQLWYLSAWLHIQSIHATASDYSSRPT